MADTKPVPDILDLINQLAKQVGTIRKTSRNQDQGFNFRGIDAVLSASHGPLTELGIVPTSEILRAEREMGTTKSGGTMHKVIITVRWRFTAVSDGTAVATDVIAEGNDMSDKAATKAMSVSFRTAVLQITSSPTDDVVDPDAEAPENPLPPGEAPPPKRTRSRRADAKPESVPMLTRNQLVNIVIEKVGNEVSAKELWDAKVGAWFDMAAADGKVVASMAERYVDGVIIGDPPPAEKEKAT